MPRSLLALILLPALAFATIFVQRPLQDQIEETPTIVRGDIGSSYSDWGSDGASKRLYTYYHLQISEVLKGDAETGPITIRELGGEKDGVGMQVAGAAHFSQGEDVVVFLEEKNDDGSYDVHGLASGKLDLAPRADGQECLSGIALAQPEADGFVHPDEGDSEKGPPCSWTLAGLRQAIRDPGAAPVASAAAPALATARATPAVSPAMTPPASERPAAPQLQPPASQERGISGGEWLWIMVLAAGFAVAVLLLRNSKR